MKEKKTLKIIDDYGKEIEYEILCAFKLEKTGKNYVVYTDNTKDEDDNLNVFASVYYLQDSSRLYEIETEEEWIEVEKMLNHMQQRNISEESI